MDDCYDVDVPETDEPSTSSSSVQFPMVEFGKVNSPSASLAMFYPQLAGYDIHPFLLNTHHDKNQNDLDVGNNDKNKIDFDHGQSILGPSSMMSEQVRQKYKEKQKLTRRRTNDYPGPMDSVNNTTDYAVKNCKSFFCRDCGKSFKFQTSLLRHNNKVHISKYQCPTCNRVFSRQAYLDVHTSKQGSSCFLGNYVASKSSRSKPK
ncbi:uncharacterized protein LOC142323277 [Lycorma delicatula]|uniref:uncharacterized protein LOC142323277 n=1 Tax=Lycorma delicatula TaxID=130591 RepID=UPI003F5134A7